MKIMPFNYGAQIVLTDPEGFEIEHEIGPCEYRALYEKDHRGRITHLRFERNETRTGKPAVWLSDTLPRGVQDAILEQIRHEDAQEQARLVQMYDEERV